MTIHRNERVLAFMIAAIILVSIIGAVAFVIGEGVGVKNFGEGVWPAVITLPYIGFPIAIALMIVLVIMSAVRRSREAKAAQNK